SGRDSVRVDVTGPEQSLARSATDGHVPDRSDTAPPREQTAARHLFMTVAAWFTGERDSAPVIWLEKQVFVVRWLGIAFVVPVLLLFPFPSTVRLDYCAIVD